MIAHSASWPGIISKNKLNDKQTQMTIIQAMLHAWTLAIACLLWSIFQTRKHMFNVWLHLSLFLLIFPVNDPHVM